MANTTPRWFKKAQGKAKRELASMTTNAMAQSQVIDGDTVIETYLGSVQREPKVYEIRYSKVGDTVVYGIFLLTQVAANNGDEEDQEENTQAPGGSNDR